MKLAILGGGGVRIPMFVRGVLSRPGASFGEICLFEPDQARRETIGRLSVEVAAALGAPRRRPGDRRRRGGVHRRGLRVLRDPGRRGPRPADRRGGGPAARPGRPGDHRPGRLCDGTADDPRRAVLLRDAGPVRPRRGADQLHQPRRADHPGGLAARHGPRGRGLRHAQQRAGPLDRVPRRRPALGRVLLRRPEPPRLDLLVHRGGPRAGRHAAGALRGTAAVRPALRGLRRRLRAPARRDTDRVRLLLLRAPAVRGGRRPGGRQPGRRRAAAELRAADRRRQGVQRGRCARRLARLHHPDGHPPGQLHADRHGGREHADPGSRRLAARRRTPATVPTTWARPAAGRTSAPAATKGSRCR